MATLHNMHRVNGFDVRGPSKTCEKASPSERSDASVSGFGAAGALRLEARRKQERPLGTPMTEQREGRKEGDPTDQ
jgi:hypothetical protein